MNPVRPIWFYTYVLKRGKDNNLYIDTTCDLVKRLEQHNKGLFHPTKHKRPLRLVYFEASLNKNDAYRRERYLK